MGHLEGVSARARRHVAVPARGLAQVAMRTAAAGSVASAGAADLVGGTLLGSAGLGGLHGHGGDGGGSTAPSGGSGGRPAPGTGPDPAGAGPDGPLGGVASARSTGVGTTRSPGWGIPVAPPHPEASAAVRRMMAQLDDDPSTGSDRAVGAGAAGPGPIRPLPRQSGALHADGLGRDRLGIRLIATRQPPSDPLSEGPGRGDGG